MSITRKITIVLGAAALALPVSVHADDWPQWGNDASKNMVSTTEKDIPTEFEPGDFKGDTEIIDPATTENVRWVAKMGSQTYGNPTVAKGRVYVGTNNDANLDYRFKGDYSLVHSLDEKTGEVKWTLTVPKLGTGKVSDWEYLGICSSPAIHDGKVYVMTNKCEVICLDVNGMADGNQGFDAEGQYMAANGQPPVDVMPHDADILWVYNMTDELNVFPHNITTSSILVVGDTLFVSTSNGVDWSHTNIPSPKAPVLIALDKNTGELLGEEISGISQGILHGSWSSPAFGTVDGQDYVIFGGPDGWCYAFDPKPIPDPEDPEYSILKELWRYDCNPPEYRYKDGKPIKYARPEGPSEIIATPVFHDGKVYVPIGQDPEHGEGLGNLVCIDPTKRGDITQSGKVWEYRDINRSISTPAVHDGIVYVADFSGFVYAVDAKTGEKLWEHDSFSHIWGSCLVVDGKVVIGNEDGDVTFLKAGREYEELSVINVNDPIYSSPIAANGAVYIATTSQLYAISQDGK
ncbi:MAG: outer membrane protein assembly factor BamB family protein [Planctomycetota bacterium]|jgi:outer membrane protein assembly factor BamB